MFYKSQFRYYTIFGQKSKTIDKLYNTYQAWLLGKT